MEDGAKNKLIFLSAVLIVILTVFSLGFYNNSRKQRLAFDKEKSARFDLEDKINNLGREKDSIEQKLSALSKEFEAEKAAHQADKNTLQQEQLVTQTLKDELQRMVKLKEALEKDLKEALVRDKEKSRR